MEDLGVWRKALTQSDAQSIHIVGQNYGRSFDSYGPVTITANLTSTGLELIGQAGKLLSADHVAGPYNEVIGASAPYAKVPISTGRKSYRVLL